MNNTVVRTISGIGFIIIMLCGLLVSKFLFAGLVMFIMTVMMHEFYTLTMNDRYRFSRVLAILACLVLFMLIFAISAYDMEPKYVAIAILPVLVVMINSLYVRDKTEFGKFSDIYTGILYIGVPLSLSNLIVFFDGKFNGLILLCFFIIIWCSDIGGFVFGSLFGKRFPKKLFPAISPKKTWVGFWGGMICSSLAAVVLKYSLSLEQITLVHTIILAVLMHVAGVYGDLFESQWKRHYNIKDSGVIIPGHGGMLDRFDSSLMAIPVGALYLIVTNIL